MIFAVHAERRSERASGAALTACVGDPYLVLTDLDGPALDGAAAAWGISKSRRIPIILLAERPERTVAEVTADSEVYGYMAKPINRLILAAEISAVMARFRDTRLLVEA